MDPYHLQMAQMYSNEAYLVVNKELLQRYGPARAIFLSNLIDKMLYFQKKQLTADGSFFLLLSTQRQQTGMGTSAIRQCTEFFREAGILTITRRGVPPRNWYTLDLQPLFYNIPKSRKSTLQRVGNRIFKESEIDSIIKETKHKEIKLHSLDPAGTRAKRSVSNKNKEYVPLVETLWEVISARKKVKSTAKPKAWANILRMMVEVDGLEMQRVSAAIKWLSDNPNCHEQPYCPIIESARSLREKFEKLERFIAKQSKSKGTTPTTSGMRRAKDGSRILL